MRGSQPARLGAFFFTRGRFDPWTRGRRRGLRRGRAGRASFRTPGTSTGGSPLVPLPTLGRGGPVAPPLLPLGPPRPLAPGTFGKGGASRLVAGAAGSGSVTAVSAIPVTAVSTIPVTAIAPDERGGDALLRPAGAQQLEPLRLTPAIGLGRKDRGDEDAIHLEVGVGPHHVADLGAVVEEGTVQHALGLTGPGGAPRPGPVFSLTGELDLDPACHPPRSTYRSGPALGHGIDARRRSAVAAGDVRFGDVRASRPPGARVRLLL